MKLKIEKELGKIMLMCIIFVATISNLKADDKKFKESTWNSECKEEPGGHNGPSCNC